MILSNVSTEDTLLVIDGEGEEIDLESDTFLFEIESFRHSAYNYFEDILLEKASHRGKFFIDQNGLTVQDGAMYGTDEQGDLYDLEPFCSFRPSEY